MGQMRVFGDFIEAVFGIERIEQKRLPCLLCTDGASFDSKIWYVLDHLESFLYTGPKKAGPVVLY
jgi:hypothetical protein